MSMGLIETRGAATLLAVGADWLNFHHLYYFWRVARAGGLSKAAAAMSLSHSTISAQVKSLEAELGAELVTRRGRGLVLTPLGEHVASYADDIFRLGREVKDLASERLAERATSIRIGVTPALPKSLALRLVAPAFEERRSHLVFRQGGIEALSAELAQGRLHVVVSDEPVPEGGARRVFSHLLGSSSILLYAVPEMASRLRTRFPECLEGARLLLPSHGQALRRELDRWLADRGIRPEIVGEFDDAGMMRVAGAYGIGILPVRAALRAEVEDAHAMEFVGALEGLMEKYYVLTTERRARHAAVARIVEYARKGLDSGAGQDTKRARATKEPARRKKAR